MRDRKPAAVVRNAGRRNLLFGLSALSLSACTDTAWFWAKEPPAPAVPSRDPLARFRLPFDAKAEQWVSHLHPPRLRQDPRILALSSGAEDGAFGAGALCGWSVRGDRPEFDVVTGVSTGALISPFAFLGSAQDETLVHMFTSFDASDLMRFSPAGIVRGAALFDTTPMTRLIESFTPAPLLEDIARRHADGGRLFVVTSHLETSRAMVWNMGAIAQARRYDLFRAVLRASSALPGVFPPVRLRVGPNENTFYETHVDGGVHVQVLAAPQAGFAVPPRHGGGGHLYLIINNTLNPGPQRVSRNPLGLSQQALTTMIRASAASQANSARILAHRHGLEFSQTSIKPEGEAVYDPSNRFSRRYMEALFRQGFQRASSGQLWEG